jgi:hypothetical protein
VADFFGSVYWLCGTRVAPSVVETKIGRFEVCVHGNPGPHVLLGFRPECLQILDHPNPSGQNSFGAVLSSSIFLGDQFVYNIAVKDQVLIGKSRLVPACRDGRLQLYVEPSEIMVFPDSASGGHRAYPEQELSS